MPGKGNGEPLGSSSKAGHGEQATFPQKEVKSLFHPRKSPALLRGLAQGHLPTGCQSTVPRKGSTGEGRAEPRPELQPQGCHSARSCSPLHPSHPIPAAGAGVQGTVRVRVPAVTRAVMYPHWDHPGQEEVPGSEVFIPILGKGEKQGTEGGARGTRGNPPMTAPAQAGGCQLSMLLPVIHPFPGAINK